MGLGHRPQPILPPKLGEPRLLWSLESGPILHETRRQGQGERRSRLILLAASGQTGPFRRSGPSLGSPGPSFRAGRAALCARVAMAMPSLIFSFHFSWPCWLCDRHRPCSRADVTVYTPPPVARPGPDRTTRRRIRPVRAYSPVVVSPSVSACLRTLSRATCTVL
jgi:hypothetical protein